MQDTRSITRVLSRSLRLKCPACGQSSLFKGPFRLVHHCPTCRALFRREEGFFVGAILGNVMATEFIILLVCMISLVVFRTDYEKVLVALFILALVFPPAFYHHSWSLWLGFDYLVESLPKYEGKRGNESGQV